jgi:DNA-binding NtrC family response regulator
VPPLRVVIADPCPDNRDSLALLLSLEGITAEQVESLAALDARLRAGPADAVVSEIFATPELTSQVIRNAAPEVPVAFYTTRGSCADYHRSAAAGCQHFVKPLGVLPLLEWLTAPLPSRVSLASACGVN